MKNSGRQVAAARDLLGLSQIDLANAVAVSKMTIVRFENGPAEPYPRTLEKIQTELETRGLDFTNGEGPGVRLNIARAAEYARAGSGAPQ
jgi:transcriptional regulator with XRE-family HTH domain